MPEISSQRVSELQKDVLSPRSSAERPDHGRGDPSVVPERLVKNHEGDEEWSEKSAAETSAKILGSHYGVARSELQADTLHETVSQVNEEETTTTTSSTGRFRGSGSGYPDRKTASPSSSMRDKSGDPNDVHASSSPPLPLSPPHDLSKAPFLQTLEKETGPSDEAGMDRHRHSTAVRDETSLMDEELNAVNRISGLVSMMTTGTAAQQVDAANEIHVECAKHGDIVRREAFIAGGAHMLKKIMIESGVRNHPHVRDACAAALQEICKVEDARLEISQDSLATLLRLIDILLAGTIEGSKWCCAAFVTLVQGNSEGVRAACAELKAVRRLSDLLDKTSEDAEVILDWLNALRAVCDADSEASLRKLAWGGGLRKLVTLLSAHRPTYESGDRVAAACLCLMLRVADQSPRYLETMWVPSCIEVIASLVADVGCSDKVQSAAARLLGIVSAQSHVAVDVSAALVDHALPRACEVIHRGRRDIDRTLVDDTEHQRPQLQRQSRGDSEIETGPLSLTTLVRLDTLIAAMEVHACPNETSEGIGYLGVNVEKEIDYTYQLRAACAALIAHLMRSSRICCHVVIFHAEILHTLINMLVISAQCPLAEEALKASKEYAMYPNALQ